MVKLAPNDEMFVMADSTWAGMSWNLRSTKSGAMVEISPASAGPPVVNEVNPIFT
ncbi:MAG: hypothetical protein KY463_16130 [Actinobacteria bacterium]|nr:hypothetical protein [Actinomycetota bacterium]